MQIVKRFFYFFSIFLLYVILREFLELYALTHSLHPVLGYLTLSVLIGLSFYFIAIPVYRIIKIPKNYAPTKDPRKEEEIIQQRLKHFRDNPYLIECEFNFADLPNNKQGYKKVIERLQKQAEQIRKKYVLQLFYSTSISQNGFLDAILILSSSVNIVKDLFVLYHGRVSNKDLLAIAKKVYFSMAIGGSEGVEYATQELFSKFATGSFKSVPFADKLFGSLADGFINASLLTRISIITENYCKMVTIKSERDLYPSAAFIIKTTKFITGDIFDKMTIELYRMSKEKTVDYVMMAVNPVAHLFNSTLGKMSAGTSKVTAYPREVIKEIAIIANKPFIYGMDRLASVFKRDR